MNLPFFEIAFNISRKTNSISNDLNRPKRGLVAKDAVYGWTLSFPERRIEKNERREHFQSTYQHVPG